jgi:hypothetical protein
MLRTCLSAALAAATLSGCVTASSEAIGPYPTNWEQALRDTIRKTFFDPYSIRDARATSPQTGHLFFQQGWVVCFEANAKNRMGGYTGLKRTAYLLNNGQVVNSMTDAPLCNSPGLHYTAFTVPS